MKPAVLSLLLFVSFFTACKQTGKSDNAKTDVVSASSLSTPSGLNEVNIFQRDAVRVWMSANSAAAISSDAADALFMKGVDAYRNAKDLVQGESLFMQSLLKYPTAKAYYELGNISMDRHLYRRAISAYDLAEAMGFSPLNRVLYNTACAFARLEVEDSALAYLEYAVEAGYNDGGQVMKDPDLAFVRNGYEFHTRYASAVSGASNPEATMFQTFLREFPSVALPLTLNNETKGAVNTDKYMSYEFEKYASEMEGERFSRDVSKEFFYYTKVSSNEDYTAVIYAIRNSISGENAPFAYVLASYTPGGKLIDKIVAGGQVELSDPLVAGVIKPNLHIELKDYRQVWEKDPEEEGYYDNKVISTEAKGTRNYHIADNGRIVRDSRSLSMR